MIKSFSSKEKGFLKKLGENLRKLRNQRGISQEELAYSASIDRTYLSDIENGKKSATIIVLNRIADALRVNIKDLLNTNGKK